LPLLALKGVALTMWPSLRGSVLIAWWLFLKEWAAAMLDLVMLFED
jgi:hypothetical protein